MGRCPPVGCDQDATTNLAGCADPRMNPHGAASLTVGANPWLCRDLHEDARSRVTRPERFELPTFGSVDPAAARHRRRRLVRITCNRGSFPPLQRVKHRWLLRAPRHVWAMIGPQRLSVVVAPQPATRQWLRPWSVLSRDRRRQRLSALRSAAGSSAVCRSLWRLAKRSVGGAGPQPSARRRIPTSCDGLPPAAPCAPCTSR